MTDFAALIEKAIEQDLRERLMNFLSRYEHVELGRARSLTFDEASLVLACVDQFYVGISAIDLGVAEIRGLRGRLEKLARAHADAHDFVANTCFDALACITALEARLCRSRASAQAARTRALLGAVIANDF
jgi:hypothetical protein